jgi:replicative DNA helicase
VDNSLKTEQLILATFIDEYNRFIQYHQKIKPDTFYYEAHQDIYRTMLLLHKESKPIDDEFILKELKAQDKNLEKNLVEIITTTPAANIEAYIKELQKFHIDRVSKTLSRELINGNLTIDQLQTKLSKVQTMYEDDTIKESSNTTIDLDRFSPFFKKCDNRPRKDKSSSNKYDTSYSFNFYEWTYWSKSKDIKWYV